jgi:hypothetical protein
LWADVIAVERAGLAGKPYWLALVLQAAPAEFGAMRRVAAATAPPGTQMLGVLGRLANLAS